MRTVFAIIMALVVCSDVVNAELLVYEGFDYATNQNLAGLNGGLGFGAAWEAGWGGGGYIWGANAGPNLDWDGAVSNDYPMSPTSGVAYCGFSPSGGSSDVNMNRQLETSAGAMADDKGVLWLSAVFHFVNRGYGAGLYIGLGNGIMHSRGTGYSSGADFMGGTNPWNNLLNTTVTTNGVQAVTTNSPALPPTSEDLIVILKYTFGASDKIEGCVFSENDELSEDVFDANKVGVTHSPGIDENTFNMLSVAQGREENAMDEIRIATTFEEVIGIVLPPSGTVIVVK